jgi:photosystem II stability/assembly factor-like uncharacterized protein
MKSSLPAAVVLFVGIFTGAFACGGMTDGCGGQNWNWRPLVISTQDTWQLPISVAGVSRYNSDCHPSISADGRTMVFNSGTQNGPPYDPNHAGTGFNVYQARWNGIAWDSVRNVGRHINPASYPTISPGGETLYYVKANKLCMSVFLDTGWSAAVRLPYPVNDSQPQVMDGPCAVTSDGHQMYFKSQRAGGFGNADIWVVRILPGGFDSLQNLGPNVNTPGTETHPAVSPDKQRLYFSDFGGSRSGRKYGDCDLYVSHWTGTEWGPTEIMPAPVNTDLPCCSAFETPDGKLYLGSEVSEGTAGEEDVWVTTRSPSFRSTTRPVKADAWSNTAELPGAAFVYRLVEQGGAVFAATAPNGDVFRTSDQGLSWQNTAEIPGESHIYSLIADTDSSLLCGTYPNGKVFRSTDHGASWTQLVQLPYAHAVRMLFRKTDGTLFAGTSPDSSGAGRIWRSTDQGATWQRTGDVPFTAGGVFCMAEMPGGALLCGGRTTGDRFFVSLNNGGAWTPQALPYPDTAVTIAHLYFFCRTSDNRLWTGGWAHGPQGILLNSTNNGLNWDTVGRIPNGPMIVGRVFDMVEASDGSYLIGFHPGPDSVAFRSTDGGVSWHKDGELPGANEVLCLLRASDGTVYAGATPNGDVFRYGTSGIAAAGAIRTSVAKLEIAPNPCRGILRLSLTQSPDNGFRRIDICNSAGRCARRLVLRTGTDAAADLQGLPEGAYFLSVPGSSLSTARVVLLR